MPNPTKGDQNHQESRNKDYGVGSAGKGGGGNKQKKLYQSYYIQTVIFYPGYDNIIGNLIFVNIFIFIFCLNTVRFIKPYRNPVYTYTAIR